MVILIVWGEAAQFGESLKMKPRNLVEEVLAEEDPTCPLTAGDVAHLKSGGPTMTVRDIRDQDVECEWFDKNVLKKGTFKLHSLRRGPHSRLPIISLGRFDADASSDSPPWERDPRRGP